MIHVVTTFSKKGYEVYGRTMIESFDLWPRDVKLFVYHEGEKPADASPRAIWVSLEDDKDRAKFLETYKDKEEIPGDYRFRVARYSHKVFAQTAAPRDCDYLIWLDGDTETIDAVTPEKLKALLPDGQVASYLGRPYHRHSETGFIAYNMKLMLREGHSYGAEFLDEFRRMYVSGDVCTLPEWHDCMVFDFVRRRFERAGYRLKNLCPGAHGLNVFEQSPLAKLIRHNKGPERKEQAYGDPMVAA